MWPAALCAKEEKSKKGPAHTGRKKHYGRCDSGECFWGSDKMDGSETLGEKAAARRRKRKFGPLANPVNMDSGLWMWELVSLYLR